MRRPLWIEVWYQGGKEANVRIRTRGWEFDFPGLTSLYEALQTVNGMPPEENR